MVTWLPYSLWYVCSCPRSQVSTMSFANDTAVFMMRYVRRRGVECTHTCAH